MKILKLSVHHARSWNLIVVLHVTYRSLWTNKEPRQTCLGQGSNYGRLRRRRALPKSYLASYIQTVWITIWKRPHFHVFADFFQYSRSIICIDSCSKLRHNIQKRWTMIKRKNVRHLVAQVHNSIHAPLILIVCDVIFRKIPTKHILSDLSGFFEGYINRYKLFSVQC